MPTDFTISLANRPGTLAAATSALGSAGINIQGQCAYVSEGRGVYHVLVADEGLARRALIDANFVIEAEQPVVVAPLEHRPGATHDLLSRLSDKGVNVDLVYVAADGSLVIGGSDPAAIRRTLE